MRHAAVPLADGVLGGVQDVWHASCAAEQVVCACRNREYEGGLRSAEVRDRWRGAIRLSRRPLKMLSPSSPNEDMRIRLAQNIVTAVVTNRSALLA